MITDPLVQETTAALEQRTVARLGALIEDLHPADLAELVRRLAPPHRLAFMLLLDEERAASVLEALEPEEQTALVRTLTDEQVSGLLEEMATDEVVDLLGELPAARVQRLLRLMGAEEAGRIRELLRFPEDSAGALMTTDLVTISAAGNLGIQTVALAVRGFARGEIEPNRIAPLIGREVLTAALIAAVSGALVGAVALGVEQAPTLAAITTLSMVLALLVASAVGIAMPVLLARMGRDPAVASGPLVTSGLDLTTVTIYLTVAAVLLARSS